MNLGELFQIDNVIKSNWDYSDSENEFRISLEGEEVCLEIHVPSPYEASSERQSINAIYHNPQSLHNLSKQRFFLRKDFTYNDNDLCVPSISSKISNLIIIYYRRFHRIPFYFIEVDPGSIFCARSFPIVSFSLDCSGLSYDELNYLFKETNEFDYKDEVLDINYHFSTKRKNLINTTSTNTKVRRIGYWKLIIEILNQHKFIPINFLPKLVEAKAATLKGFEASYVDKRGMINLTKSGISSMPYIDTLRAFSILTVVNNSYLLSKHAKVYTAINRQISISIIYPYLKQRQLSFWEEPDNSPFLLNDFDKMFFLHQILKNDSLYFCSLLDILFYINQEASTKSIKLLFKNFLLEELKRSKKADIFFKNQLDKRIKSWKKEMVYLEHIVEPRINWMVDLGLASVTYSSGQKKYTLNSSGKFLHRILIKSYLYNNDKHSIMESFLENNYFKTFSIINNLNYREKSLPEKIIKELLLESFEQFKTIAPRRIPASNAIYYICYILFFKYNMVVEFREVKDYLQNSKSTTFGVDWYASENDGSLYLKK